MEISKLEEKARWVFEETLKIHYHSAETRVASSLSPIEILVALYYGCELKYNPKDVYAKNRDRIIISKGHGSICLYPILADCGYYEFSELKNVGKKGSFLGGIPDPIIPGYETINGSLGHGPGVACGMALALKRQKNPANIIVLCGDGELHEGSVWEAFMFAAHHKLDNLQFIIDNNSTSMLDRTDYIVSHIDLAAKFQAFGFDVLGCNGHAMPELLTTLKTSISSRMQKPKVVIAKTVKGHGVKHLEESSLCHILGVSKEDIVKIIGEV